MIGIGPNIGSSIFLLIGLATEIVGPALLITFLLNFIVTIFTALAYAELSSAFPETGGGYLWIKEGLFEPLGFQGGWMSWIGHCIACSVYAIGFGTGVSLLLDQYNIVIPGVPMEWVSTAFTVGIAVLFCLLNIRGVKGAGKSEILVSSFLLGIIVLFCLFCIAYVFGSPDAAGASGFGPVFVPFGYLSIATSMGFTFMIFEGYEVVAQTGEEAKDPERTVPKAMFLCITISAVLFITVAAVTFATIGWEAAAVGGDHALNIAADRTIPFMGGALMSVGMIIGSVAAVNSIVFSTSRVSFAMGRDGNLPTVFGKLHPETHTPVIAILISGIIIIVMAVSFDISKVATVADVLILLLFVLVNLSAISLRKKRPDAKRSFITPFFPWIPIIGVVTTTFLAILLFELDMMAWYIALAVIFAGLLVHYFAKGRAEIEHFAPAALPELSDEAKARYRVLVPIDDPKNEGLVDMAVMLAAKNQGEIVLITVAEVPHAVPLSAVDMKLVEDRAHTVKKAQEYSELRGIKARAIVSVSHDVVATVIDTAKEQAINVIIVGWKGYTHTQKRVLGRKLDDIVRQTPCDIMVLKTETKLRPEKIMILSGGLWHVSKATEVAADIAQVNSSRVTILNVIINERYLVKASDYSKRLRKIVEMRKVPVIIKDIRPESFVGGVVAESLETDLLVIGSSAAKRWDQFAFGAIQDTIAKNARSPVLVYKRVAPGTPDAPDDKD